MNIRRVQYFNVSVHDRPGAAYELLAHLASEEVNLLAFNAVPIGPNYTQLVLFPESVHQLETAAAHTGIKAAGPHFALMVQGDDELGALAGIHKLLAEAHVNVFSSAGVTDARGGFGYVIYVRDSDFEAAAQALGV